jgi:hypothetical protein
MLSSLASTVRRVPLCATLLLSACGCPPLVEGYASPDQTLLAWQAHLCRDDAQGEYGCLAASFQRAMGGFQQYHAARAALLEQQPAMAWLFARSDLLEHIASRQLDDAAGTARVNLRSGDDEIEIGFERETWLTLVWADGRRESFNQEQPLSVLLGSQLGRQWLTILKPPLTPNQLGAVRSLSVEGRWKIADIAGLEPGARAAATGATP